MSCLPQHGRVECTACFKTSPVIFDKTQRTEGNWQITSNPLSWGNPDAEIVVLGFSKGPSAAGASLANKPHDEIAYAGSGKRTNVGKILAHVGVIEKGDNSSLKDSVDKAIADRNGRFHFGSLIRCKVEQYKATEGWVSTGGGMLDKFVGTDFGEKVSQECSSRFLGALSPKTKLIIMFGMGTKQNYVRESYKLFQYARPGKWDWLIEDVSYIDNKITVVHVEHFSTQGAHLSNWLGEKTDKRNRLGLEAKLSVQHALGVQAIKVPAPTYGHDIAH